MQIPYVVVSLILSVALLTCAEALHDNSIEWNSVDDSAIMANSKRSIFDDHEADPFFSSNLFFDVDSDINTNLEEFSSPIDFLADAEANENAATSCLFSSSPNSPLTDTLLSRSPKLCPNLLDGSDPDFVKSPTPLPNDPDARGSAGEFPIYFVGPHTDSHLCPPE